MDRVKIKEEAKKTIKGRLWKYIYPGLIIGLIMFAIAGGSILIFGKDSVMASVISLGAEIAFMPVSVGLCSYYMKLTRKQDVNFNEVFNWYGLFGGIFVLGILSAIFISLWTLLLVIPGIIAAISYSMSIYMFVDGNHDGLDCIRESKKLMNGFKADYFVFNLSFIGWHILAGLTFGILYIWLMPYVTSANIIYYDELKKHKAKEA